jgi:hypothetical protein
MLAFSGNASIDQSNVQGQMRLRDDPSSTINPVTRNSRKRKSPSSTDPPPPPPPPPPQQMLHHLPPPHAMIHPMQGGPMPPHYPYADYTPGGMPPNPPQDPSQQSPTSAASGRALSSSKRAEQNRKAQRAFRERRDQLVSHTRQSSFCCLDHFSPSDTSKHSSPDPSS